MKRNALLVCGLALALIMSLAVVAVAQTPPQKSAIPQRQDIPDKYKWRVDDMYPTPAAWEADFERLKAGIGAFEKYKGLLGESADALLQCLRLQDSLSIIDGNLYVYANLKLDEDNRQSQYQELAGRSTALDAQFGEAAAFVEPEILTIDPARLESFLKENAQLATYRFYLEDKIRLKAHILSAPEEEILALASPMLGAPMKIFNMIDNADHKLGTVVDKDGNRIDLTYGRYGRILRETDRDMRRQANDTVQNSWVRYVNTLAANLGALVDKDLFLTKARKYNSTLERSLDGNNIPTSVFRNIIEAVNAKLPILHKWTGLRKKVLKVDTLYTYDLAVPLAPEMEKRFGYEEAKAILMKGLAPLGSKYMKDVERGLNSGWVDVFETEGKATGGYNWGTYTSHPYILLNYDSTLELTFTLAHEMGHALQRKYTDATEPYIYHGHSLFTAEVASTCNEAILMQYLINTASSKQEKIMLLNQYITQIEGTFVDQVMYSEYEDMLHEYVRNGGAVSVDFFRSTYRELLQKYYGPEVVIGPLNDMGVLKVYHFYRTYYVYQYATSYAAAQMISQKILAGDKQALDAYMKFLATGTSQYPMEILKEAGVDMNSPEPVDRTLKLLGDLVDQMEQLLKETGQI
jgi:oligoendopeptidase F